MTPRRSSTRPGLAAFALAAVALLAAGCGLFPPTSDDPTDRERLIAEQAAKWADAGLDSYTFTISRACFCPPEAIGPFTVTVVEGQVTDVTYQGASVDRGDLSGIPLTIEATFTVLESLMDDADLTVTWDPELGYPIEADVDPMPNAIDDEFGLAITELIPAD